MKICIGYYDSEGKYIGDSPDTTRRKKFVVLMGKLRKKIAERDGQSPYKHAIIEDWTKTYCDRNRIEIYADIYINGKLSQTVTNLYGYCYWQEDKNKDLKELMKRILTHAKKNIESDLIRKYKIENRNKIYYPMYI